MATAAIAGSLLVATNAGAVAVLVPETAISSPQYGPVLESTVAAPAFACNADGCLAAWRDGRQGLSYRIWARRLRADGTPRDPAAFLISVDNFDASDPVVATDGTRFIVGWTTYSTAYLTRVDTDDSLHTESATVTDFDHIGPVVPAAIASNGDGYLLVFGFPAGTPDGVLRALRADRDGHILDATPILISDDPTARGIADVIWTGTQYLVVWNQGQGDGGDAYAVRVLADGTVMDATGYFVATLGGFSNRPHLALGGGKILLAAGPNPTSGGGSARAFLLDTDGRNARVVSLPIPVSIFPGMTATTAWNGSAFVVTWIDGPSNRPVAARVAPDGTAIDTTQIFLATSTQTQLPAIAAVSGTAFIVYVDMTYKAPPIRLVSLSASGVAGHTSDPPLDTSAAPQRLLATARGAGHTLVVWADDAQGTRASALLAARVSDTGVVLDATPIVLSAAAPDKQGALAAAAWAGDQYLVSWWERTSLTNDKFQVARISGAGQLRDTAPTVLGSNLSFSQMSSIVPAGDKFLLVWSQPGIISTPAPINAVFIGSDGKPSGATFRIGPTEASYPWAVAAAEGGGYLAAWNRFSGPIYGVEMEPIDGAGVQGSPVHVTGQQASGSVALVPGNGRTLLWMNGRAGMLLSAAPPFTALSGTTPFDVKRNIGIPSWNAAAYVSAGVTTPGHYDFDSVGVDVNVLSADGVLSDPPTTIVAPRPLTTLAPTVVTLAPNKNLVVYSRLVPEHDFGALRVRFQIVDSAAPVTTDGGVPTDGGTIGDGGVTLDSGFVIDGGDAGDAVGDGFFVVDTGPSDAVDVSGARDVSGDDRLDAQDATIETAPPDSGPADAAADRIADASEPDLARRDATADVEGTMDAPTSRDAGADAASGSSAGCSCALSPTGGAANSGLGLPAILMFAFVACLHRRHRRRGR